MITLEKAAPKDPHIARERRERLAARIEALPPEQLDLRHWEIESECGTVACIAGWARIQAIEELGDKPQPCGHFRFGLTYLGLTFDEAHCLFYGNIYEQGAPAQAALALRRLNAGDPAYTLWNAAEA